MCLYWKDSITTFLDFFFKTVLKQKIKTNLFIITVNNRPKEVSSIYVHMHELYFQILYFTLSWYHCPYVCMYESEYLCTRKTIVLHNSVTIKYIFERYCMYFIGKGVRSTSVKIIVILEILFNYIYSYTYIRMYTLYIITRVQIN